MPKTGSSQALLQAHVERLEAMVKWLAERSATEPHLPCVTCGHDIDDHLDNVDESSICLFPVRYGSPFTLCHCMAYEPQTLTDNDG